MGSALGGIFEMLAIEQELEIPAFVEGMAANVLVISTEGSATRIAALRTLDVKEYIRKPFRPEEVRDSLKAVLGDWSHDSESRAA